jgi:hypothetical protein
MGKVIITQLFKLLEKNPELVEQFLKAAVEWSIQAMQEAANKAKTPKQ